MAVPALADQPITLPTTPLPIVYAPPSKHGSEDTILAIPSAEDSFVSERLGNKKRRSKHIFCCCLPIKSGVWILALALMVPCLAIILSFWVADLRRVIRFNVPHQTRIVYTIVYALYFLLGMTIGFVIQRLRSSERHRPLIMIYWILISATILEGIYFGVLMAKQKAKIITFCDPTMPNVQPFHPPGAGTNSTTNPSGERPITCRHAHGSIVGALYIIGPAVWLALHVGWILLTALLCKALRKRYERDPALCMSRLSMHHSHPSSHHSSILEPNAVCPPDSTHKRRDDSFVQLVYANPPLDHAGGGNGVLHSPQYDDERDLRRPSLSFRHASQQFYLSVKSKLSKRGSTDLSRSPYRNDQAVNEQSSDEEDDDDEYDDDNLAGEGIGAGGGSSDGHRGDRASTSNMTSAGKLPATAVDGKGWWIRQLEAKRRGEFCPCTDEDGRHLPEPVKGCWCGRPRVARPLTPFCTSATSSSLSPSTHPQNQGTGLASMNPGRV